MTTQPTAGIDSPRAWWIVAAAFTGCFVVFGIAYAFGVFLKPMSLQFGVTHAVMSALFSFMTLLSYLLGPLTGDLADRFGPRPVVACGGVLMAAGLLGTAHADSFWVAFLCFGLGVGGGLACVFVPGLAAVGEWFKKKRDLAIGVSISGIGCGTLAAAPISAMLIARMGWRGTLTVFGVISGTLLLASSVLLSRAPVPVGHADGPGVLGEIRTPKFSLLYVSVALSGIAIFISMIYLPAFAAARLGMGSVAAAALVGYIGGASVVARLGLEVLAERFGLLWVYQFSFFCVGAACIIWLNVSSHAGLVLFAIVLGIGYGGVAALTPAVAISMFGIAGLGELLGFLLTAYGCASVIGPPLAGYLVDRTGNYDAAVWYATFAAVASFAVSFTLRKASQTAGEAE